MSTLTQSYLIQIKPDPFINCLSVIAKSTSSESASIYIYNEYGNAVYRSELNLNPGINTTEIELEDCPPGVYYLHYKTPISKLFVIRRLEKIEDFVNHN
jgi:hypothetical protein